MTAQRSDLPGVKRAAYGTLTGFVVAPDETPIPAAQVTLASGVVAHSTRRTAADGSFRFIDIPPAVYEIKVVAPGFRSVSLQSIRVTSRTTTALGRILLDVGQISGCPTLPAGPPTLSFTRCQGCSSALEGAAVVMYNLSGSGVTVVVRSAIGQEIARTTTGSSGRFTFFGLAPGEYTLTASKAGHIDFLADAVTIHDGQRTLMIERLPIYPCPIPVVCYAAKEGGPHAADLPLTFRSRPEWVIPARKSNPCNWTRVVGGWAIPRASIRDGLATMSCVRRMSRLRPQFTYS